jgi:hypothetical protein
LRPTELNFLFNRQFQMIVENLRRTEEDEEEDED